MFVQHLANASTQQFMSSQTRKRISSIDLLRGLVMVLMALDHVRDYFSYDAFFFEPTDLTQSNIAFFFTRFVTHFCAPVFVFLAGTSAFLVGQRLNKKELSVWLLKRGIWLVIAELTIVKFAWFFKLDYTTTLIMVIWALGVSMIFLAAFIHLPKTLGIALCLLVVFGHNLFDGFHPTGFAANAVWSFLHEFNVIDFSSFTIFIGYPLIPWIFVMPLGYYFGALYTGEVDAQQRRKTLLQLGFGVIALFFALRSFNFYGDAVPWEMQESISMSIASFFNVSKYPPSLLYLLITLGPAFVFLAFAEKWQGAFHDKLVVIGRVPMFFYIVHLYVIHLAALIAAVLTGYPASAMVIDVWVNMQSNLQGYGFSLGVVYLVWLALVIGLYPLCNRYNNYKNNNRDKWWLSYL